MRENRDEALISTLFSTFLLQPIAKGVFNVEYDKAFNALSVVFGFTALFISNFMPIRFFGFLVFISILACLVGAMLFIPAILLVFQPRFTEPPE